ncbi:hypothetical protein COW36_11130 [bacterium (Candidatus Blackallbacteria) CG17_big_fil_post_rev_8_21_14_2_50_48_46]|uniref:Rieske domain-containing protein n=1 Tax=bacterium (Candidatus Blackallbacteria) CG17_big_fil_post_rev_8_21_14_2_50_48_46 TaxID=2014261 RepID=A0A2M7G4Q3_9BACT|nr:MAG: hypothetical protein COW64_18225 [bacterium (Candidatus Blackallbacteria) CG18_big_fil_WC_8_21_14_2_50_49_26]PIW16827.1 MAG: hypothetical protein COW36_11130 [bacterium (Candidatus Blackallbacteria) CG17_big_fil_post_rev_8_21_14_2_50_48_46]PIW48024.1 MAG: hypothetical protein COW20_10845 [bacterium (Candidatus Blackallbacteria) CG13_big_fil_rev_8_21_14_2_50_49_14]
MKHLSSEEWIIACTLKKLEREQRVELMIQSHVILILLNESQPLALLNRCPHQGYPLSSSRLDAEQKILTCPFHEWSFSLLDGHCLQNQSQLQFFPLKVEAGMVCVKLSP